MTSFDSIYYIALSAEESTTIRAEPDEESGDRFFQNTRLLPGRPLMFHNRIHDKMVARGDKENVTDVLFSGGVFMINDRLYQRLADFEIDDLQFYPAIYTQVGGTQFEFNMLIFDGTSGKDWYDRDASEYSSPPKPGKKPFIERYSLDVKRMRAIPEERRLMFRMNGVQMPSVFVHERIFNIFQEERATGIQFFQVSDYEDGMEYE